ncbi:hypothetical protein [Paenibacillus sp. PL2-23]|uniref:hypothetical protein n=1 Tax=Paenibacillus sp. PL2-23 TaxID=2100729 RepID=UPI0030FA0CD1
MRDYQSNLIFLSALIVLALFSYVLEGNPNEAEGSDREELIALAHMEDYDAFYALAESSDERTALQRLEADDSMGIGAWTRDALIVVGLLPYDQARLTLSDAEKIVKQGGAAGTIVEDLNAIAGAPDWQGGSGIDRKVYYMDDERTEAIVVLGGVSMTHVVYDNGAVKDEQAISKS